MNISKIIVVVLGLAIVVGIVFYVLKPNKSTEQSSNIINPASDISGKITEVVIKPIENDTKLSMEYGKVITLAIGKQGTFADGLNVSLKKINDSRCPQGVECIWAGELSAVLELSSNTIVSKEIVLGTIRNKEVVSDAYTFSLKDANKESISLLVVKK